VDDVETLALLRMLIADTSTSPDQLFNDSQLRAFLTLGAGNVRLAAADALDAIATSEVLISKKIRTQDLQTDGPAVAAELRAQAKNHRALAQKDLDDANLWDGFDVVDTIPSGCRPELTERQVWGL